jgi:phosphatidylglycerophosphate synthase
LIHAPAPTLQPATLEISKRDLRSFTADIEKRVLVAIARRLPSWIGPDHLTALGVISMAGASICYRLVTVSSFALIGVNVFLFLNWFGDSLDGTLARVRQKQRPRYGFFVDHLADAFGAIFLLAGLGLSGLVPLLPALALLIAYLLLQVHIALKAHTTRVFQIAFGGVGGTEARMLLAAMNTALMISPGLQAFGGPVAWACAAVLVAVVVIDGIVTGRALDREERALWSDY